MPASKQNIEKESNKPSKVNNSKINRSEAKVGASNDMQLFIE